MMTTTDILQNLHIEALTPMQQAMAEAYDSHDNLVLLSPTGSGKTLAFLLPLVGSLRADREGVQAVVLAPSRELALQIETVFRRMGTPFKSMCCYGGRPAMDEHRTMNGLKPAVVIGTPGRMNDHLKKHNFDVSQVTTLVIDEFDKSLELGFQDEMAEVLSALPAVKKRVLLSATDAEEIPQFVQMGNDVSDVSSSGNASSSEGSFLKLNFLTEAPVSARLNLYRVLSPEKDKLDTLYRLLCSLGDSQTMVFVNYRESVDRVAAYLSEHRFPCDRFHGGMEQQDRERALYKFRNGSVPVLVSTDLAARGLDIPGMEHVVHYHLPLNQEAFTHRNGRTARWDATGSSFLILHGEECLPGYLHEEEVLVYALPEATPKPVKPRWTTIYIGKGKKDKLSRADIVGFMYKKGALAREELGTVDVKDHYAFVAVRSSKAKQLLRLVHGEKIKGIKTLFEEAK